MKSRTWILILGGILLLCLGLSAAFLMPGEDASMAEIWSDGVLVETVSLQIDRVIRIEAAGGTNVVTVKDGRIAVTEADCPDHYCMDRGFCSSGAQIVCLPNRLVIHFVGDQNVDGVVG